MAYLTGQHAGGGLISWQFGGLQYSDYTKYAFSVSTSDGKYTSWDDGTNYDTTRGHTGGYVTGYGRVTYKPNGSTYSFTSNSVYVQPVEPPPPPPPPPTSSAYVTASVTNPASTQPPYTIRWTFNGLQYSASNYTFDIITNDGREAYWYGGSGASNTTTGHAGNTNIYTTVARANYNGIWYAVQGTSVTTPMPYEPARVQAVGREGGFIDWWIMNLGNNFNQSYYMQAAVFSDPFQNGATNPTGKISAVNAPFSYGSNTTPTVTIPGQSPGARYMLWGGAQAANGRWYTCDSIVVQIPGEQFPPSAAPSVTASPLAGRRMAISWSKVYNATGYAVYMQNIQDGQGEFLKGTTGYNGLSLTTTVDSEYTLYQIRVVPTNAWGDGPSTIVNVRTLDETQPFVASTKLIKAFSFRMDWNAYDQNPSAGHQSGFYRLRIYISAPGGGNTYLVATSYAGLAGLTFGTDGLGDPIKPNTRYRIYSICEDNALNQYIVDEVITTRDPSEFRPANFAWDTPKVSGQPFNLTASEWIDLRETVQEFRQYKELPAYSFSYNGTIYRGQPFTANIYNEMRSAIMSMSPPAASPSAVSPGDPIGAIKLNAMRDYLNSIP